ncbi:penicillin-binding protein activator [Thiothrix subterranea]|uniref:Penicillin-binding protein activator n=1 Tax=Thiothrix subterranea TaxID=2735563 RepID=A0AA51MRP2_9GAMM|nr:penicillin-binding protein activator [Thiothrix subterranea]MDQ5769745.1 penicillin-binding protein activator [Thiothrix subterranea]WML87227.1 penicillin-binding protein activator [Thiothrix subterranea]
MPSQRHPSILKYCAIALLTVTFMLQGCSPNDFINSDDTSAVQGNATVEQANALFNQGKKREAAQAYFAAATRYPTPQRERVILQAAEIAASIGDAKLTNTYLAKVPASALDGENRARQAYVKALLALQQNNPRLALRSLPTNLDELSPALREKVKHIQQRAQAMASGKGGGAPGVQNVQAALVPNSVTRVAALLPQSGSLGSVGQEIYRGIDAARNSVARETSVQVYDVNAGGAVAQYQRAVADGADIVIGPLDKESLADLLAQPQVLSKPLLSLNYLTNSRNIPGALYQFGLLPEDEAKQVAETTSTRGLRTAIVLAPASSWGDRIAGAFRAAYQAKGGQVINIQQFPDAPSNAYLQNVQNALAATQGRASMVFLAASPSQARLMRSLLAAQAPELPIYATSHIFSGRTNPGKDADLDGILYTEIPWVMEGLQSGTLNNSQFPRMFALGMDAFLIAKNLPSIARNPSTQVNGKTGNIRLAGNRQIQRTLLFATFVNGVPQAVGE